MSQPLPFHAIILIDDRAYTGRVNVPVTSKVDIRMSAYTDPGKELAFRELYQKKRLFEAKAFIMMFYQGEYCVSQEGQILIPMKINEVTCHLDLPNGYTIRISATLGQKQKQENTDWRPCILRKLDL